MTDNSSAGVTTNTPGGAVPTIIHNGHMIIGGLPEGARNINLNTPERLAYQVGANWSYIKLPPGTWQLIGLAAEVTEGQWREIVELRSIPGFGNGYRDYEAHAEGDTVLHGRADTSGQSLLRSHNLKANQTVILKLIEA